MSEAAERPSYFQRAIIGVKGFASHAIGYIPRGIALTSVIFAGSALLETAYPGAGLNISQWTNADIANIGMAQLAFGSTISGVMGAGSDVYCACKDPSSAAAPGNPLIGASEKNMGENVARTVTDSGVTQQVFAGSGLPMAAKAAQHLMGAK